MNAGPELDALVAEKVFGVRICKCWLSDNTLPNMQCRNCGLLCRRYSEWIQHAWQIVERLAAQGMDVSVNNEGGLRWQCEIDFKHAEIIGFSETAPHAICLAALRAVGVEVPA